MSFCQGERVKMAFWEQPNIFSGEMPTNITGDNVKPDVALVILHTGSNDITWTIRTALIFMHFHKMKKNFTYLLSSNQPYDTSREIATRSALKAGAEWIFHYDTDILMPVNTIELLIKWSEQFKLPIISGLYWAKKPGPPMPAAWLKIAEHPEKNSYDFAPIDPKPYLNTQNIVQADVTGAGCMLINRKVFEKLDKSNPDLPYFQWGIGRHSVCSKCGHKENLPMMSEDFYFCMRAINELNIHPNVSFAIKCDHISKTIKRGSDGEFELLTKA